MPIFRRNSYPLRVLNFYSIYRMLDYSVWDAIVTAFKAARR